MPEDIAESLEERIVALETRIAFQDDVIETLNATVTEQWSAVEKLARQLSELRDRLSEAETRQPLAAGQEIPPHY